MTMQPAVSPWRSGTSPASSARTRERAPAATAVAILALLGTLSGCATPTRVAAPPAPASGFTLSPGAQPVVSSGRLGWPVLTSDPNVYADDEGYHLFYTTYFCRGPEGPNYSWDPTNPSACIINDPLTSIAYAFSADEGLTWEFRSAPVIMPSDSGFDAVKIETAAVFRMGDTLYMAYCAYGNRDGRPYTSRYQIGLAQLPLEGRSIRTALLDGTVDFQRHSAAPLLASDERPGRFDNNVQEPSVVVRPDGIELFYIGLGLMLPDQPVGVPGQRFTAVAVGRAVLDRQFNVISRSTSPVLQGVNMPEVHYFDGAYHAFAATLEPGEVHRGGGLSYAVSSDGVTWSPPREILPPGPAGTFSDWGVMAPTAAVESDRIVLFFTAFGATGAACRPVGPDGRFGLPVQKGANCVYATVGRAVAPRRDLGKIR
jgi:hypothetical protein